MAPILGSLSHVGDPHIHVRLSYDAPLENSVQDVEYHSTRIT